MSVLPVRNVLIASKRIHELFVCKSPNVGELLAAVIHCNLEELVHPTIFSRFLETANDSPPV